jgi:hypothetical protein
VDHLKCSPIGQAPALPTNIRLGWKGLPGANIMKIRNLRPKKVLKHLYHFISLLCNGAAQLFAIKKTSSQRAAEKI